MTEKIISDSLLPELLMTALAATTDGIVITDREGNIEWINSAYEKLTGYKLDEIKGENHRFLSSGKQGAAFYKSLWETILSGNTWRGELWNKNRQGKIYFEEQSITPVKNAKGEVTHFVAIKRNVTEQHHLQKQVNIARRIDAVSQLTAGVAHNFNNKLASILGFADLALEDVKQYNNSDLEDSLSEIIIAGKKARDLVRQMMAFSVTEPSKPKNIDIALVIQDVAKFMMSTLPASISVQVDMPDELFVNIDPVRLHQMLMNLTLNASEAMQGQGNLLIQVRTQSLNNGHCSSCHAVLSGEFIAISVRDNGHGIKPEDMENIFIPFYSTRLEKGNVGMGLPALHGVLHDMQGHLIVDSKVGQYTEVTLFIPTTNVAEKPSTAETDGKDFVVQPNNTQKHILLVDDEVSVVNFMSEMLKLNGFEVTSMTDSKAALKAISQLPDEYDLLITDISMPQLSGTELVRLVRDIRHNMPVILMSGYDDSNYQNEELGNSEILAKPFETKTLLQKVNDTLNSTAK